MINFFPRQISTPTMVNRWTNWNHIKWSKSLSNAHRRCCFVPRPIWHRDTSSSTRMATTVLRVQWLSHPHRRSPRSHWIVRTVPRVHRYCVPPRPRTNRIVVKMHSLVWRKSWTNCRCKFGLVLRERSSKLMFSSFSSNLDHQWTGKYCTIFTINFDACKRKFNRSPMHWRVRGSTGRGCRRRWSRGVAMLLEFWCWKLMSLNLILVFFVRDLRINPSKCFYGTLFEAREFLMVFSTFFLDSLFEKPFIKKSATKRWILFNPPGDDVKRSSF